MFQTTNQIGFLSFGRTILGNSCEWTQLPFLEPSFSNLYWGAFHGERGRQGQKWPILRVLGSTAISRHMDTYGSFLSHGGTLKSSKSWMTMT